MRSILRNILRKKKEFSSKKYWDERYSGAGNSGSGSYGRLAEYKAGVLNNFVERHGITRVLELGCGDGNQLSLANYNEYLGIDVSATGVELCKKRFTERKGYDFQELSKANFEDIEKKYNPELVMSLDVIFHLTEDEIFDQYMRNLFNFNNSIVVIYSSNGNFKIPAPHIRNHVFTDWISRNATSWQLIEKIDNDYPWDDDDPSNTSFCDFYFYEKREP